jgi:PPOX class probable F420-dependent enzyme
VADAISIDDRVGSARVAHLATADADGSPHIVAVTLAVVADRIVTVVDGKPKSTSRLKRLANIAANPAVSLLVDHYDEDWATLWWTRLDGRARVVTSGPVFDEGIRALHAKYSQYRLGVSTDGPMIVIEVLRVVNWSAH